MKKIMVIFGTRPEAIKMAPVIKTLADDGFDVVIVVSGQHKEMLTSVLDIFGIKPNYNLKIMQAGQTLTDITTQILTGMEKILEKEIPDCVLVHGDTSTAMAAAMAAFYQKIPVGHVEAGLRTHNIYSPYPEEMNRQVIDRISSYYFAPTKDAYNNLLTEGINDKAVFITGNTGIDALKYTVSKEYKSSTLVNVDFGKRVILLTMHRRENIGVNMENIFDAINEITIENKDVEIVFPMHLNPVVRKLAKNKFNNNAQIHLIEPLDVIAFHNLMSKSYLVLTDSGGIQEEAPALGKPVLVLRNTTERPEGVEAGALLLVGTEKKRVKSEIQTLLDNKQIYNKMSSIINIYGDGNASKKISNILKSIGEI